MKRQSLLLFVFFMVLTLPAFSQGGLLDFNLKRQEISRIGMWTLGGWAATNFLVSGIGWARGSGSNMYFHQGNVLWNTVNAGIAGVALYSLYQGDAGSLGFLETIQEHFGMEKTLLFNAGLDVGYMATGFYLHEKARNSTKFHDRFKGYGSALILQGAFLFVFDLVLFGILNHHGKTLETLLLSAYFTPEGVGMVWRF
ncbi:MAG: hypothetical protein RBS53_02730 [Bacteroidales bacterium]|jgi:hypothetical protein|nr:hypothetical protein [Bacteroidales bacterium]NLM92170.1 hypothetical protein [Bacteroidales bacterium]